MVWLRLRVEKGEKGIWLLRREVVSGWIDGKWFDGVVRDWKGRMWKCRICWDEKKKVGFVKGLVNEKGELVGVYGGKVFRRKLGSREVGVWMLDDEKNWVIVRFRVDEIRKSDVEEGESWDVKRLLDKLSGFEKSRLRSSKEWEVLELLRMRDLGLLDDVVVERWVCGDVVDEDRGELFWKKIRLYERGRKVWFLVREMIRKGELDRFVEVKRRERDVVVVEKDDSEVDDEKEFERKLDEMVRRWKEKNRVRKEKKGVVRVYKV